MLKVVLYYLIWKLWQIAENRRITGSFAKKAVWKKVHTNKILKWMENLRYDDKAHNENMLNEGHF